MHLVGGIGMGVLGWADHDDDCDGDDNKGNAMMLIVSYTCPASATAATTAATAAAATATER